MQNQNEPEILKKPHKDWPWIFKWVPRRLTAFQWGTPKMVAGNQVYRAEGGAPKPIGEASSWQISYFPGAPWWAKPIAWYLALTLTSGRHFRLGARWDDEDNYVQWPSIASRKYDPEKDMQRDTSTK